MKYKKCSEGHVMDPSWKYCPVCLSPLAGWLVTIDERGFSHKFYTIHEGKSFIGSGLECEVYIPEFELARQQAYIVSRDGMCTISNMGSTQMLINNAPLSTIELIDGDLIQFGDATFKIKLI